MAGRFAPTPTSDLHIGNLRTGLAAFLAARSTHRTFRLRVDDLDHDRIQAADGIARRQLADLARLHLTYDGPIMYQSERTPAYVAALEQIRHQTYECFCSRRDLALAAQAPHASDSLRPYPGTCRNLSPAQRSQLRRHKPPALRVRADDAEIVITDRLAGRYVGLVDDFVVRRGDGVFAYNFATVVDDQAQGVDQVVRGDDLLSSAPRQAWLAERLGYPRPEYAHVPLVIGPAGSRLAKRDQAISLERLLRAGWTTGRLTAVLGRSLGLDVPEPEVTAAALVERFAWAVIPADPWVVGPDFAP